MALVTGVLCLPAPGCATHCTVSAECRRTDDLRVEQACDLSKGAMYNVWDLLHHFETCQFPPGSAYVSAYAHS